MPLRRRARRPVASRTGAGEAATAAPRPATGAAVTVRSLMGTVVAMVRTRVELLHADLVDEQENLGAQVRLTMIAGASGLLCAMAALSCIVLAVPESYRVGVLAGFVLALGGVSMWSWQLRARHRPRPDLPFRRLLDQLRLDADTINDGGREERPDETK